MPCQPRSVQAPPVWYTSQYSSVHGSTDSCLRPVAAMQAHCLLTVCLCFFGLISSSGATVSETVINIVNEECKKCDTQFTNSIMEYQVNYGQWKTSLEGAQYFCGNFEKVQQCYVDCLGGRTVTYLSMKKRQFDIFYAESCDPVCYVTVMPWCYMKHVGYYRLDQSCDKSAQNMKANLGRCLVEELFYKQRCNGSCTAGQRRANFIFMQLHSSCLVPLNNKDDCFNWVQYCIGNYYGSSGDDFALQTDDELKQNNDLSCKFHRDSFVSCVQRSVSSLVTLGEEPSLTSYDRPCNNYQDQIDFLEDLTRERLTKAICQYPDFSLSDICNEAGSAVEPTTRSPTTTSTSAFSVVVSTAKQPQPATIAAASPTQASGSGGGAMVSDPLKTVAAQSVASSQPATDAVPSSALPSTAALSSQPASDDGPSPSASLTAADGGGGGVSAPVVDSQPTTGASAAAAASTSLSTSGITTAARASSPAPAASTRKNLVLDFFNLPSTTPAPTTTRRPRATLGGGMVVGGGQLLLEGPPTTPGDPLSTTVDNGDQQESTDDQLGGDQAASGRVTRPHKLIAGEDSSSALTAAPLSLLAALLLQVVLLQRLAAAHL